MDPIDVNVAYFAKAVGAFSMVMLFVWRGRRAHPFARFGPANQVTSARVALAALVAGHVGGTPTPQAATVAVIAAIAAVALDSVDGWLARRTRMASEFGARFDMETDALLVLALAVLVWQYERAGVWVLLSGALRYAFLAAGWLLSWLREPLPHSIRRQTICVAQVIGLIVALTPAVPAAIAGIVAAGALSMLIWSFWIDVTWLWRHGRQPVVGSRQRAVENAQQ